MLVRGKSAEFIFEASIGFTSVEFESVKILNACYWSLALLVLLLVVSCKSAPKPPLPTVSKVDLAQYAGRWHEVARLPNAFQRDDSKAIAEYTPQADGSVKVVNTEMRPDGSQKQVVGSATAVPETGNSRLRVKFGGLAALAPASKEGNYWIIKLADDYSVALVGTPSRKFLWLLARDPKISESDKQVYLDEAKRLGFATDQLLHAKW